MQYTRDMFSGRGKLHPLDNDRYPDLRWTSVRELLASRNGVHDSVIESAQITQSARAAGARANVAAAAASARCLMPVMSCLVSGRCPVMIPSTRFV